MSSSAASLAFFSSSSFVFVVLLVDQSPRRRWRSCTAPTLSLALSLSLSLSLSPLFDLCSPTADLHLCVCLQQFCCNGTIVDDPELGQVIQLQGDQRTNISKFLVDEGICEKTSVKIHGF